MLKAMCSQPPCMNMDVKRVRIQGASWTSSVAPICLASRKAAVPSQTTSSTTCPVVASWTRARSHSLPGCVTRYGIAPYSTTGFEST